MSDVPESEDNFWLDQPQNGSSKDLIAKLSEVTLNNGYLQEQMAIRDQYVLDLTSKVENLEAELKELKRHQMSGLLSHSNINNSRDSSSMASPITKNIASAANTSPRISDNQGFPAQSTPVSKPSVKSRLGPRIPAAGSEPPKIDANFFAGLSESNSPEKRLDQEKNDQEDEDDEDNSEQESPRPSTSYDDGIHFEPIISLPQKVEKITGEEDKKILFSERAKLYRFVKDDKSWKERGKGTMKILSSQDSSRFRVLMRRDHTLKICANHLITSDMELKAASGSENSLVWTTMADYADEVSRIEQLAVRFKTPEDVAQFKDVFNYCKKTLIERTQSQDEPDAQPSTSSVDPGGNSRDKSACKPDQLLTSSKQNTTPVSKAGFALKPAIFGKEKSDQTFGPAQGNFSFDFKPQQSPAKDSGQAKPNKAAFASPQAEPFAFTSTAGSPLKFSFGPTQAPSTSSSKVESSSKETEHKFPTLFSAISAPKSTDKGQTSGFSFGSSGFGSKTPEDGSKVKDTPLKFSSSPNVGFGISDDEDESNVSKTPNNQGTPKTIKTQPIAQETAQTTATAIMPQLFWQQQPEEKFKFGNLHKTQPFAGMAPTVSPASGKSDVLYPASFMLTQIAKSPPQSQSKESNFLQPPKSNPFVIAASSMAAQQQNNDYDECSDDDYDTETEDTESYDSDDYRQTLDLPSLLQLMTPKDSVDLTKEERKALTPHSPEESQCSDDDCVISYQLEASKSDQEKALRLMLPTNFFSYLQLTPHQGSLTKVNNLKSQQNTTSSSPTSGEVQDKKQGFGIFGASGKDALSFSSFNSSSNWGSKSSQAFPMAGQQLFSSTNDHEDDPSKEADIHFKPAIALPDLIERKSGEDDHTLQFSERAKLYRFDTSSSMWKERGIGNIKLLLDNKSGRGRVVMRRDQVHKLCANHWVTNDMSLVSNSTSERSWVWQTLSDFSEEDPSQEKLAVRFKSTDIAKRFKEVFDDLISKAKAPLPMTVTKKIVQSSAMPKTRHGWECDACYCPNEDKDIICIACGSKKAVATSDPYSTNEKLLVTSTSGTNSGEKEDKSSEIDSMVSTFKFTTKVDIGKKPVFTIGRGNGPEDDTDEIDFTASPSRNSPSKSPSKTPVSNTVQSTKSEPLFGSGMETFSSKKFNFRLELTSDGVKATSPAKSPVKSPIKSPKSPETPGSHPETEDDGIHFEPLVNLPKLEAKKTGEENEVSIFCERAKLYRFDAKDNQWKERGLGEVKILCNPNSGKSRILMRRENVLKICLNHQLTPEMALKPKSEKAWIWNTFADFADEVPKPETLAIRFKNSEIALSFKDSFEKAQNMSKSDDKPDCQDLASVGDKADADKSKGEATDNIPSSNKENVQKQVSPSKAFLFGSSNVSTLSFASVAANIKSSPELADTTSYQEFEGKGTQLFSSSESPRKDSESEDQSHDPHFEAIIPLPEKIDVKTGEEEEEVVFCSRAKLYRFDKELKHWKERGIGEMKILFHNKNCRSRVLMRRDQIHKICANHYITKDMILAPNNNSSKSFVWNTLADFSDEEVKAEQLAVRFKLDTTAQEFKAKFEECKEKAVFLSPAGKKDSKNITQSSESLTCTTTGSLSENDAQASLFDKLKPASGSWECDVCLIQNKAEDSSCIACQTQRPGANSLPSGFNFKSESQSKPIFSFGGVSFSGSQEKPSSSSESKPIFSFGGVSSSDSQEKPSSSSESKPIFSFGGVSSSDSQEKPSSSIESKPIFSFGGVSSSGSQEKPSSSSQSKQTFIFGGFSSSGNASQEKPSSTIENKSTFNFGEIYSSRNDPKTLSSVDGNKTAFSFGIGSPKPTGFSFGQATIQTNKPPAFSLGSSQGETPSSKPIVSVEKNKQPADLAQGLQKEESGEVHEKEGANEPADSSNSTSKESLIEKFKPKQGAWECEQCLIQNKADSTVCIACQTPKPGIEVSQAPSNYLPTFNFGMSKPSIFSFDSSNAPSGNSPFSFGSGSTKGTGFVFGDPKAAQPGTKQPNEQLDGKTVFGTLKPATVSISSKSEDKLEELASSFKPQFVFGAEKSAVDKPGKDSLNLVVGRHEKADSTGSPEIEEIYSSVLAKDSSREGTTSCPVKGSPLEENDPTITAVFEPSIKEKERAQSLFLPEGFFLYERKTSSKEKADSQSDKPLQGNIADIKLGYNVDIDKPSQEKGVFGSSSSASFASFSDMSQTKGFAFGAKNSKGFSGQGTQLFSSNQSNDDENPSNESDIYFEPIVSLPKVEMKTGEENEHVIFSHRAKLYRFDSGTSAWKERGVGDIKIMKKDEDKFRILMRRDQIRKLCANHIITKDMKLVANNASDRSWVWNTMADWSEETPSPEQLAVRFKFRDTADKFKQVVEECQDKMKAVITLDKTSSDPSSSKILESNISESKEQLKSDTPKVQQHPSSTSEEYWECGSCYTFNVHAQTKCLACSHPKYLTVEEPKRVQSDQAYSEIESFAQTNFTNESMPTGKYWMCTPCQMPNLHAQTKCISCSKPNQDSSRKSVDEDTLEAQDKKCDKETSDSTSSLLSQEGNPKEDLLFGKESVSSLSFSSAAKSSPLTTVSTTEPFSFKGLNEPRSKTEDKDEEDDGYHNVSGDNIHFDPIIPLPNTVQVVTGEENHEVLFKERAKLFRFDKENKQWKERGVGELKILSKNGRARIVMRRDQIHKLCANHAITPDMNLTPNGTSGRSWIWQTLADFSQQEQKAEQLAVRFKTEEIANSFKKTFDDCTSQESPSSTSEDAVGTKESLPTNQESGELSISSSSSKGTVSSSSALVPKQESEAFHSSVTTSTVQRRIVSSKTITKQESSEASSSVQTMKSSSVSTFKETKFEQSQTKEVQDESVSSSEGSKQLQLTSPRGSPTSIFNQQLLSHKNRTLSSSGLASFGQSTMQSSLGSPKFTGFGTAQGASMFGQSSELVAKEWKTTSQTVQVRKIETSQTSLTSVEQSHDSKTVSCSPEISKMLQEMQDSDKK